MLIAKPNKPKPAANSVMVSTTLMAAKMYGNFDFIFSENIGNSHTNMYDENTMSMAKKISPQTGVFQATSMMGELAIPTMSSALAGVGMPIKEWC